MAIPDDQIKANSLKIFKKFQYFLMTGFLTLKADKTNLRLTTKIFCQFAASQFCFLTTTTCNSV